MTDSLVTPTTETPNPAQVAPQLRDLWTDVLYVDSVEDSDNFVALGGDSIAATLCAIRIRTTFGVDVPAASLLMDDTSFATLVHEIETLRVQAGSAATSADIADAHAQ